MKIAKHFKVSLDFLLGWEDNSNEIDTITQVAEMMAARFSDDPQKQQEFFSDYVIALADTRRIAVELAGKLDDLEWKTRMVLGQQKTVPSSAAPTDKDITTRAQIGAAKVLAEAQRADAESQPSQKGPSTSGKSGEPAAPSRERPGRQQTPLKPVPK